MGAATRWIAMGLLLAAVFQRDASAAGSTPKQENDGSEGVALGLPVEPGIEKKRKNSEGEETRRREK